MSSNEPSQPKTTRRPHGCETRSKSSSWNRGARDDVAVRRQTWRGGAAAWWVVRSMMCQRCHNEATVHLTEPAGGEQRELHLCRACAKKAGLSLPESPPNLALDAVVASLIVANVGE